MERQNKITRSSTRQDLLLASLVASGAGILGGTADLLLFYTPGFSRDLFLVRQLPNWRIQAGTLLAIVVIPCMTLGYWALSRHLTNIRKSLADGIFLGGVFGVGLGTAIHGTVGTLVQVVQSNNITIQDVDFIRTYAPIVVPLYALFYLLMAVGTLLLAWIIWQGKSRLPRWFILLLPLWSNVLILPMGWLIPTLGDYLYPSIANFSHAVMFSGLAWWTYRDKAMVPGFNPEPSTREPVG